LTKNCFFVTIVKFIEILLLEKIAMQAFSLITLAGNLDAMKKFLAQRGETIASIHLGSTAREVMEASMPYLDTGIIDALSELGMMAALADFDPCAVNAVLKDLGLTIRLNDTITDGNQFSTVSALFPKLSWVKQGYTMNTTTNRAWTIGASQGYQLNEDHGVEYNWKSRVYLIPTQSKLRVWIAPRDKFPFHDERELPECGKAVISVGDLHLADKGLVLPTVDGRVNPDISFLTGVSFETNVDTYGITEALQESHLTMDPCGVELVEATATTTRSGPWEVNEDFLLVFEHVDFPGVPVATVCVTQEDWVQSQNLLSPAESVPAISPRPSYRSGAFPTRG
jgi:hypothetical protein